jgi:hypothetical protein
LALAAGYLWERLDCHNLVWKTIWGQVTSRPFNNKFVGMLRDSQGIVAAEDLRLLHKVMKGICRNPEYKAKIIEDFEFISLLIEEAGLSEDVFPNVVDFRFEDQRLLSVLKLTNHVPENQPSQLVESIGGMWHVIRRDTSREKDEFNVSLVNIKPLTHYRKRTDGKGYEAVISHTPRFSFRSRGENRTTWQEYRGSVIKLGSRIYFLSTREDKNSGFALMCWSEPSWRDSSNTHADVANGLMLVTNASDAQIAAPIVAQFIDQDGDTALSRRGVADDQQAEIISGNLVSVSDENQEEAEFWLRQTAQGAGRAKRYTRLELAELDRFNQHMSIDELVRVLDTKIDDGAKGFFLL